MQENHQEASHPSILPQDQYSNEQPVSLRQIQNQEKSANQGIQYGKVKKSAFVGTGFTFDLSEFFRFGKKAQIQPDETFRGIYSQICGEDISWIILLYSVINASFITVWILSSKINKYLALTWRYIFEFLLMIPFVLYEKRTIKPQNKYKYQLAHIFNTSNLKQMYIYSFSTAIWYGLVLTAAEWTSVSHALYLGSLVNFFVSFFRHFQGGVHRYELGGQVMIVIGVILIFIDTFTFEQNESSPEGVTKKIEYHLSHSKSQRLLADIIALSTSIIISRVSIKTSGSSLHLFPPYLSMLILDGMNAINMLGLGYFLNGVTFDMSSKWGFFSVVTDYEFVMFLYGCLVICLGLVISSMLVSRMFPNHVIPSIAYFFEPGISTVLIDFTKVQVLPQWYSLLGYAIMTPGMVLIAVGQWLIIRRKQKQHLLPIQEYQLKQNPQKPIQTPAIPSD